MKRTYRVVRVYRDHDHDREVLKGGLTLEEAQAHCRDPETSSSKATSPEALKLTARMGPWFDAYDEE